MYVGRRHAGTAELDDGIAHHDLGSAQHGERVRGIEAGAAHELRHHADVAAPVATRGVDRDVDLDVAARAPARNLLGIEHVVGRTRAVEQHHAAVVAACREDFQDGRAQRREADAAGDEDDVPPARGGQRPGCAVRAAHAELRAGHEFGERPGDGADRPYRVHEPLRLGDVTADRNRALAAPEGVEHVELARRKRETGVVLREQFECERIGRLVVPRGDGEHARQHRVRHRRAGQTRRCPRHHHVRRPRPHQQ